MGDVTIDLCNLLKRHTLLTEKPLIAALCIEPVTKRRKDAILVK